MKLSQASKDLLAGARFIERNGFSPDDPHPLCAVARSLQVKFRPIPGRFQWRDGTSEDRYHAAADQLHAAAGVDNADLSPEEAVDVLVAAAMMELP